MRNTATKGIALSAALLLTLAACGDNDDPESNGNGDENGDNGTQQTAEEDGPTLYDFTNYVTGAEEIRFEIPEELIELDEQVSGEGNAYIDARAVESITARAVEGAQCVIELEYTFDEGAVSEIEQNAWETGDPEFDGLAAEEDYARQIIFEYGVPPGWGDTEDEAIERVGQLGDSSDLQQDIVNDNDNLETVDDLPDPPEADFVDVDIEERYASIAAGSSAEQQDNNVYHHDISCAASPDDDSSTVTVPFRTLQWTEGDESNAAGAETSTFASADLNVMSDGTLNVTDGSLQHDGSSDEEPIYITDTNGAWIENPNASTDQGVDDGVDNGDVEEGADDDPDDGEDEG